MALLSDATITALSRLIDDSQMDGYRRPSHSDLTFLFQNAGLIQADPKQRGDNVGKAKRLRAVLTWALENDYPAAGERLVKSLVGMVKGCGGFRKESPDYVGNDAIESAMAVFESTGHRLSEDGALQPVVLERLSAREMTEALR